MIKELKSWESLDLLKIEYDQSMKVQTYFISISEETTEEDLEILKSLNNVDLEVYHIWSKPRIQALTEIQSI